MNEARSKSVSGDSVYKEQLANGAAFKLLVRACLGSENPNTTTIEAI